MKMFKQYCLPPAVVQELQELATQQREPINNIKKQMHVMQ